MSDETNAATKAKAIISTLTPTTARSDANVFAVRYAAGTARDAIKSFSSEAALDAVRGEAATALSGLCGLMDQRAVTQGMIDRARLAVEAWQRELEKAT